MEERQMELALRAPAKSAAAAFNPEDPYEIGATAADITPSWTAITWRCWIWSLFR